MAEHVLAFLIFDPHPQGQPSSLIQRTLDEDRAREYAETLGCIVAEVPVVADFRRGDGS